MLTFVEADATCSGEDLEVFPEQQDFVASREVIFANAYLFRKNGSHCYIIQRDEVDVGMLFYYERPEENIYQLSELFIDRRFQNKGYGTQAVDWLVQKLRAEKKYPVLYTFYIKENVAAHALYSKFGFKETCQNDSSVGVELEL